MFLALLPGAITAALGTGALMLATATENVSLVGAGSFTAFALAGFGLMWRAWSKENRRLQHALDTANVRADLGEYRCELLKGVLSTAGVAIPLAYYQPIPKERAP